MPTKNCYLSTFHGGEDKIAYHNTPEMKNMYVNYIPRYLIDGSTARRCTAIVTNEHARLRQSVKLSGQSRAWPAFKNTGSADITAK